MDRRMNSKAVFIETSSILLNLVKQNRNPALFVMFAITFTVCRIFWIPVMGKELLDAGLEWKDPLILALVAFYGLQVHWWIKILKILWKGENDDDKKNDVKQSEGEGKKED
jgi:TLC domain